MGRPRAWPMREIVKPVFHVMRAGGPWRLPPNDLPPWGTIYRRFASRREDGRMERINHALVMADRERVWRDASPSAAIIDSLSVNTTEAGGPRGYDAGKKVNGRKRHALVDTDGRGLVLEAHPASVQARDGGGPLMTVSRRTFPFIPQVFADGRYAEEKVATAMLIAVTPHPSRCACVGSLVLHDFRSERTLRPVSRQFAHDQAPPFGCSGSGVFALVRIASLSLATTIPGHKSVDARGAENGERDRRDIVRKALKLERKGELKRRA